MTYPTTDPHSYIICPECLVDLSVTDVELMCRSCGNTRYGDEICSSCGVEAPVDIYCPECDTCFEVQWDEEFGWEVPF